jgi:hypothetical protein
MLLSLAVRIEVECPRCSVPVAVGGVCDAVTCPGCDAGIPLPRDFVFEAVSDVTPKGLPSYDEDGYCSTWFGEPHVKMRSSYGPRPPKCLGCDAEIPLDLVERALSSDTDAVLCPACDEAMPLVRGGELAERAHRDALAAASEHHAAPRLRGGGDLVVWCECGDAMAFRERPDGVACDGCEEPLRVAPDVWEKWIALPGAREFHLFFRAPPKPDAVSTAPRSFPLALGWVAAFTLIIPTVLVLASGAAFQNPRLREALGPDAAGVWALAGSAFLTARLVLLLYTVLADRELVLGETALRVPIVSALQFRPWNIPFERIESIALGRKSGSSTAYELVLKDGGSKRFTATVVPSELWYEAERALQARVRKGR